MIRARFVPPAFQILRGRKVSSRFETGRVVAHTIEPTVDQASNLNAELTDVVGHVLRLALIASGYRAVFARRIEA